MDHLPEIVMLIRTLAYRVSSLCTTLIANYTQIKKKRICILEGPEDDSIGIETCCPNRIINTKSCFVFDTSLYIYMQKYGFFLNKFISVA